MDLKPYMQSVSITAKFAIYSRKWWEVFDIIMVVTSEAAATYPFRVFMFTPGLSFQSVYVHPWFILSECLCSLLVYPFRVSMFTPGLSFQSVYVHPWLSFQSVYVHPWFILSECLCSPLVYPFRVSMFTPGLSFQSV